MTNTNLVKRKNGNAKIIRHISLFYCLFFVFIVKISYAQTIDLSRPVGTIKGNGGADPNGAGIYNLSIDVLPGVGNVQPVISLNYSSKNGADINFGVGWDMWCFSSIKRDGKSNYYNDIVQPVAYRNSQDAFVLDGQRLFVTNGTNGANGSIYETEKASFNKIISYGGDEISGPEWFQITTKDGLVMEYGHATSTKLITDDNQSTMVWLLNKVTDRNGNYEIFKYSVNNVDRNYVVTEVDYSGNATAGIAPQLKVLFTYTVKPHWETQKRFQSGASIRTPFLLNNISVVNSSGKTVRSYLPEYTLTKNQYFLTSVTEKGADGKSLNPTIFNYGSNPTMPDVTTSSSYDSIINYNSNYTGDFTGDGKDDLLASYYTIDNHNVTHYLSYTIINNFGESGMGPTMTALYTHYLPQTDAAEVRGFTKGYKNISSQDYDGDGKADVLISFNSTSLYQNRYVTKTLDSIKIYYSRTGTLGAFGVDSSTYADNFYSNNKLFKYCDAGYNNFYTGDFDGDGKADFIEILGSTKNDRTGAVLDYKAFLVSPNGGRTKEIKNFGVDGSPLYPLTVLKDTSVITMDFDGDGKTDLLVPTATKSYVLTISSTGVLTANSSIAYSTTLVKDGDKIYPGDFNGDGNTDLLVGTGSQWKILYSTGKSFESYPFYFQNSPILDNPNYGNSHILLVTDLNGDGKSDILHCLDKTTSSSQYTAYLSTGMPMPGGNSNDAFYIENSSQNVSINKVVKAETVTGDFNGDGKSDIISINTHSRFIYPKPKKETRFLSKAINGLSQVEQFKYGLSSDNLALYERTNRYDVPGNPSNGGGGRGPVPINYSTVTSPFYLLSDYSVSDENLNILSSNTFKYTDAAYFPSRGFLGFVKVNSFNNQSGIETVNVNSFDKLFLMLVPSRTYSKLGLDTIKDSYIYDTLISQEDDYHRYVYQLNKTLSLDNIKGIATENLNEYDNYGNIITNTINKGYFSGTFKTVESAKINTVYGAHGSPIPSSPDKLTITKTRTGQPSVSRVTSYGYDSKGNILTTVDRFGTSLATTTSNTYDAFGNTTKISVSAPGTSMPISEFQYDNTGRFLVEKKMTGSGITKIEKHTYDPVWGLPATDISSDGLTTSYTYDNSFGDLIKTTTPDGNSYSKTVNWETTNGARYSEVTQRTIDGGKYKKEYFDILGRQVKMEINGFNNQLLSSTSSYNSKGQLYSETEAHYSNEAANTNTLEYDNFNRLKSSTNGVSSTSFSYSKLANGQYQIISTNGAGQSNTKTLDAAERIVQMKDNGGQLVYTYDSWGNQTKVSLGGKTLITNVFDIYGRQSSLTDINAGTYNYTYDALGRLTKQTDPIGHAITSVYDAFGRITSTAGSEGTTTYVYYKDASGAKVNDNISKITGFSGDVKSYTYDNLGRQTSESIAYDGKTFVKKTAYDSFGNIIKITYPTGVVINDSYDKNGVLIKTSLGSGATEKTLFTATSVNSKGIYTKYLSGNGKSTTVNFDLVKGVATRYYTPGVQDLNLSYDGKTGNLLSRKDAIKNLTETFTYDNLNRLTGSKVNNVTQFSMTYDAASGTSLGNIATKSDVGKYIYDNNKINALKYVTSTAGGQTPPNAISQNQRDIQYTPFLKASSITENGYNLSYIYGEDRERIKSVLKQGSSVIETKYYLGTFERIIRGSVTQDVHYINAGNGLCAIIIKEGSKITPYFAYSDQLGSILTLTDTTGNIIGAQNFDAWGRQRNPNNWSYNSIPSNPVWLYRGFTGHETLQSFNLINMNGRIYDPTVGRMLSPDIYVALDGSTQGYNRYGYANNNPLIYRDANGDFVWLIPLIGAAINIVNNWSSITSAFHEGGVLSAVGTGLEFGAVGAVSSTIQAFAPPVIGGAVSGALTGAANALISGNPSSMFSEGVSGAISGGFAGYGSKYLGGVASKISNWATGSITNEVTRKVAGIAVKAFAETFPVSAVANIGVDMFNGDGGLHLGRDILSGISDGVLDAGIAGIQTRQGIVNMERQRAMEREMNVQNTSLIEIDNNYSEIPNNQIQNLPNETGSPIQVNEAQPSLDPAKVKNKNTINRMMAAAHKGMHYERVQQFIMIQKPDQAPIHIWRTYEGWVPNKPVR